MDTFDKAWCHLADLGACDGMGGAEYVRLKAEWEAVGYMLAAAVFIGTGANLNEVRDATRKLFKEEGK